MSRRAVSMPVWRRRSDGDEDDEWGRGRNDKRLGKIAPGDDRGRQQQCGQGGKCT